ncbi:hypothetical protein EDB84DRAFT_1674374 [Lactarius hengduanensis]|nr:hypothetical protein EDB84DRAFT_1674374 [Lactarius hengduanensis]
MKTHNFLPKYLKDLLMAIASGFQILNCLLLPITSTFQMLDLLFELFDYIVFIFAISCQYSEHTWQCLLIGFPIWYETSPVKDFLYGVSIIWDIIGDLVLVQSLDSRCESKCPSIQLNKEKRDAPETSTVKDFLYGVSIIWDILVLVFSGSRKPVGVTEGYIIILCTTWNPVNYFNGIPIHVAVVASRRRVAVMASQCCVAAPCRSCGVVAPCRCRNVGAPSRSPSHHRVAVATLQRCVTVVASHRCIAIATLQRCVAVVALHRRVAAVALQRRVAAVALQRRVAAVALQRRVAAVALQCCVAVVALQRRVAAVALQHHVALVVSRRRLGVVESRRCRHHSNIVGLAHHVGVVVSRRGMAALAHHKNLKVEVALASQRW